MSKVQEFLKKAAEDKALQEKMTAIMEGKPEEISDKVVALAKENGFEITFDEFLKEVKGQEGEVSDDELDNAVGGGFAKSILSTYVSVMCVQCPSCGKYVPKLSVCFPPKCPDCGCDLPM